VSLSQLKLVLIGFYKLQKDQHCINEICAWCKQTRNPGVRRVLRDGGFECPDSSDHKLIVQ
jgi:hypothetical protein